MTTVTAPRQRALLWAAVVVLVLLLVVAAAGTRRNEGPPLDPDSTGRLGTKALRLLVDDLGVDVSIGGDLPSTGAALLLVDNLEPAERDQLRAWVEAGGTLVTTDARSPLIRSAVPVGPGPAGEDGIPKRTLRRQCDVAALSGASRIRPGGRARFAPAPGARACFTDSRGAFLVVEEHGAGTLVALGSPLVWVNELLGEHDNSVLAGALLAPRPGASFLLYRPPAPGTGERDLLDLIPDRVIVALWQLVFAFAFVIAWRARRLGRPVLEPQPVELAGSELVVAVGHLLQQGRQRQAAARLVRESGRRALSDRLGIPASAPTDALAGVAASRTGRDVARVRAALEDRPVASDAELVELARLLDSIREEVAHAG